MNRERGQALIEAVMLIPVCVLCAVALVEAGVLVRSQLQLIDAAGRAGAVRAADGTEAAARAAAQAALPDALADAQVHFGAENVSITARPQLAVLGAAADLQLQAQVAVEPELTGGAA